MFCRVKRGFSAVLASFLVVAGTTPIAPMAHAEGPNPLRLRLVKTFGKNISPKSVVAGPAGLVIAQNMMYTHGISVYDASGKSVKRISDRLPRSMLGLRGSGEVSGSPVEAAFSPDGKFAWVTNYEMFGAGFNRPGFDKCSGTAKYDRSWVYKVNMDTLTVVGTVKVGEVPKFVAVSPDGKWVLVTNWCSFNVTVINALNNEVVKTIELGRYPRGIVVTKDSTRAYLTVMGAAKLAVLDLTTLTVKFWKSAATTPRHLLLSPDEQTLYVTHNLSSVVTAHDAATGRVKKRLRTGIEPRSMAMSPDGRALYVVNYASNTLTVVSTKTMRVVQTLATGQHPVGVTFEPTKNRVWVACYAGLLQIFAMTTT